MTAFLIFGWSFQWLWDLELFLIFLPTLFFRCDGKRFVENLKYSSAARQKKGKKNRTIRYLNYCIWVREFCLKDITKKYNAFILNMF